MNDNGYDNNYKVAIITALCTFVYYTVNQNLHKTLRKNDVYSLKHDTNRMYGNTCTVIRYRVSVVVHTLECVHSY